MACGGGKGRAGIATPSSFLDQVYLSLRCVAEFWLLANWEHVRGTGTGMLEACCLYVCDM